MGCDSITILLIETDPGGSSPRSSRFPAEQRRLPPPWWLKLPAQHQSLVREIYVALNVECPCLAANGARTVIDLMLTEMLGDVGGLANKLEQAVLKGLLTIDQKMVISAAVDAGHAASHRGYTPADGDLFRVLDIVEHALKDRYVMQEASRQLRDTVPPRMST